MLLETSSIRIQNSIHVSCPKSRIWIWEESVNESYWNFGSVWPCIVPGISYRACEVQFYFCRYFCFWPNFPPISSTWSPKLGWWQCWKHSRKLSGYQNYNVNSICLYPDVRSHLKSKCEEVKLNLFASLKSNFNNGKAHQDFLGTFSGSTTACVGS